MGRSITTSNTTASPEIGNQVAQIYSASGYQAGDLIYNVNGAYGAVSDTAVSTATFPVSATQTFASGNTNYGVFDVVEGNNVGTQQSNPADLLTNGNTVVVWVQGTFTERTTSAAYFKIIDSSNNEIVAPTIIATGLATSNLAQIGVVALTGGGFAVAFRGTGNTLFRAVYSNTGAVVFTATNTTYALNTTYPTLRMTATTDGKFAVIYVLASTNVWFLDIYNADGSLGSHITLGATANTTSYGSGIAARLNGATHEIGFCYVSNTTVFRYGVYSTAGTVRLAEASITLGSTCTAADMCLNLTDNNFVIAYIDSGFGASGNLRYNRINTTPALVAAVTASTDINQPPVFAKGLSTGGFIVFAGGASATQPKSVPYLIFSGTYVRLSANPGFINGISSQNYNGYSATESDGVLTVYGATQSNSESTGTNTYTNFYGMIYRFKVNTSTYLQVPSNTTYNATNLIGNTAELPVNGYIRSTATPTSANFLASTTSTQTLTLPVTSGATGFVVPQTVIEGVQSDSMDCDTLSNGNIVIVYRNVSTQTVKMAVYTQTGALVNNTTVGTGITGTTSWQNAYVAALPNGKIVVVYYAASTTALNYSIYSSTFALLNSGTLIASLNSWSNIRHPYIAGLSDNRFVVAYHQTSTARFVYAVYDDTGTVVLSETTDSVTSSAADPIKIAGTTDGGFVYSYHVTAVGAVYSGHITKTGATTYSPVASSISGIGTPNQQNCTNAIVVGPDNTAYVFTQADGTNVKLYKINPSNVVLGSPGQTGGASNQHNFASVTVTGAGQVVAYNQLASSGTYYVYTGNTATSTTTITTSNFTSGTSGLVSMTGGYDNTAVVAMLNSSQQPTLFIINTAAITYSTTVTSGVTASNALTLSPYSTPTFFLTGVAQTTAPAGGVGTVQTNGSAVLNSNYSASTTGQYFDFDTPTTFGVKGSISGRNVTMIRT